jgi:hypothetical protein
LWQLLGCLAAAWRDSLLQLLLLLLSLQAAWQQGHCWLQRPLLLRGECRTLPALLQRLQCLMHQMKHRWQQVTQQQQQEPVLVVPHRCCCYCLQQGYQALLLPPLSQLVEVLQGPYCQQTALEQ